MCRSFASDESRFFCMNKRYAMIGTREVSSGIGRPHGPCLVAAATGRRSILLFVAFTLEALFSTSASCAHTATAERYMIATVHPMATDAALDVFREGGNAVDAAVTAALTLG